MKHSKIHDKDQAEESRCEEEKGKHGSQEHMQPAGNQPPARLPACPQTSAGYPGPPASER